MLRSPIQLEPLAVSSAPTRRTSGTPSSSQCTLPPLASEDPDGDWQLPAGSALVKTFYRDERPLETRLFVRHDDGAWAGYTYAWDAGGAEATLLGAGETRTIDGEPWIFPDRSDCLYCHSEAAGFSLGLETAQLLRNVPGADGRPIDQLDALVELGLLRARPTAEPLPATDSDAPLADRARA